MAAAYPFNLDQWFHVYCFWVDARAVKAKSCSVRNKNPLLRQQTQMHRCCKSPLPFPAPRTIFGRRDATRIQNEEPRHNLRGIVAEIHAKGKEFCQNLLMLRT